jgi:hypothetical protein
MAAIIRNKNDLILNKIIETPSEVHRPAEPSLDPQVKLKKPYGPRRLFETAYKLRIISAYDACESSADRGALLRKEGLYHARIAAWKHQLKHSKLNYGKKKLKGLRTDHLVRENEQLKKKLAQAEAIIDLQKKVSELLGTHILPSENSD